MEELEGDPLDNQVMDVLRVILQPDAELSLEAAAEQIVNILPIGRPYSHETRSFTETCYEAAEQIPYDHPSMMKLITLVEMCLNSPRFLGQKPDMRYQMLKESLLDFWSSMALAGNRSGIFGMLSHTRIGRLGPGDSSPEKFGNFQTFCARVDERGILKGPHLAIWTTREALEHVRLGSRKDPSAGSRLKGCLRRDAPTEEISSEERNAYVMAAAQWLLLQGGEIYSQVDRDDFKTSRLDLKRKEWRSWHERLEFIAASNVNSLDSIYSREAIELARRASVAMDALDRQKTG